MIKNIVFDFGGVIIDADLNRAIRKFEELGLKNVAELLNLYTQNGFFLDVEEGRLTRSGFNAAIRRMVGSSISDEAVNEAWLSIISNVPLYKLDVLEQLRKKYKVYMLSNTNPYVLDWACSEQFTERKKPLDDYFDHIFASYKMGMTKPSPAIFQQMIKETGMKPEETLFVDDGARNVAAAAKLGFITYQPQNGEDWRLPIQKILEENS